jgi:integrase
MGKNLTNTLVSKVKPGAKPYEIRDAGLKGLILRVQPSGAITYYFEYRRGKRMLVGPADALSPEQARDIARDIEHEYRKGEDPIEKRKRLQAQSYTQFLDDIYQPYLSTKLRNGVNNSENVTETIAILKRGFREFDGLQLTDITPLLIEKWRQRRHSEGISAARIKRQMNDLRACLNRAVTWGALASNPLDEIESTKLDTSAKVRYLSPDEEVRLRQSLSVRQTYADHIKPAVLLSLNTGLRQGELLKLKWSDIDLDLKNLTVRGEGSKSGQTRHIPLNEEALMELRRWKDQPGVKSLTYVFADANGQPFRNMRTSWEGVLLEAGISDFRWHDLRHDFASKLVMAGVDLNTLRELLGHSDYKMTLRYAHLAPKHKQDAVNRLSNGSRQSN